MLTNIEERQLQCTDRESMKKNTAEARERTRADKATGDIHKS